MLLIFTSFRQVQDASPLKVSLNKFLFLNLYIWHHFTHIESFLLARSHKCNHTSFVPFHKFLQSQTPPPPPSFLGKHTSFQATLAPVFLSSEPDHVNLLKTSIDPFQNSFWQNKDVSPVGLDTIENSYSQL